MSQTVRPGAPLDLGRSLSGWSRIRYPAAWREALLVAAAYYLSARLGFAFTFQPHPISILWLPNSLLLAALLLSPVPSWWVLLAAALPAHLAAELQSGVPPAMVLGWFASNSAEALIGAVLIRRFCAARLNFDSFRDVGVFLVFGTFLAPLLSSFLDAALVKTLGWGEGAYWQLVWLRFLSNTLAALIAVPFVLTWAAGGLSAIRGASLRRIAEAATLFLCMLAVGFATFDRHQPVSSAVPALLYAPLPFLLWAAARFGPRGTSTAILVLVLLAIWGATHGEGPFVNRSPEENALSIQLFLFTMSLPVLLLATALEERRKDVAAQQRAEIEAKEQRKQLTHLTRVALLGQLSGALAHELNQPLTAILSNAQAALHFLAADRADPEELREILRDIVAEDRRAGEVIHRLRALFKRGETQLQLLDANDLVREALDLAHGDLVTRNVAVAVDLSPHFLALKGDRVQIEQVLLNLLVNACEAMSENRSGERQLTIRTQTTREGAVQISVVDRGPGIPPEDEPRLFEPFFTTKPQGLGLGLSISRSIVTAHGGRLWGVNNPASGATFHMVLPGHGEGFA
ncbi:MAG TPA: MASE1 domain-containing protein [Burkholderiales bacterium]|nr:MASE1 domain-containing protein [Burkholderiales bacterium]